MISTVRSIGVFSLAVLAASGRACILLIQMLGNIPASVRRYELLVEQLYHVGVLTLPIIIVSALFVGMVLALQGYNTLVDFDAESSLGLLVALSLTRELGPVLAGLLFAGRAGAALTAEIGLMKATEQLAGMEMMAVDPVRRVLLPRFLAGVISVPLLATLFTAVGILSGYLLGVNVLGIDQGVYWSAMQEGVDFQQDVLNGLFKSLVFGALISLLAVFMGYDARPTPAGVGTATTQTVVLASLLVLAVDFSLTSIMF
ncbi:putative phospholipid ABC transporter permease protein MlaE [bacterium BMS3Bbin11]|nr:putative phospholipid ABC transporter permease protein MlaE [bacterium BMS3Abin11]GBE45558.1 putative phospholipid ABC transporter permease protein MlaE [bacterium BMS3Bbin11]GMT41088.1 MAG: ABC transporter permease [bacterium]HDH14937.1 lipid asymmetry maintenance ABC transporter permease subunit MlaE [Gammaproteobacteria bacterium]HDZ79419.1 lipid asymmetry maintenance ABC transporter permease subunit MlaE [Gammaproteobacteria bacterium]